MTPDIFYPLNSQFLQVSGLKDQSVTPAAYVDDAVLVGTLYDSTGVAVTGCVNVSGQYQPGSNGVYRFPVDPAVFNPPLGSGYYLIVDGNSGTRRYHVRRKVKVLDRSTGLET